MTDQARGVAPQTNTAVPQSILARIEHLVDDSYSHVAVPEIAATAAGHERFESTFDFLSPTVLYPVQGATDRYLIGLYSTKAEWTLVGIDYLAHSAALCDDPTCAEVRARLTEQRRHIPPHGMLFARTLVDPGVGWLPRQIPYLIHIDDYPQFTNRRMQALAELDLF